MYYVYAYLREKDSDSGKAGTPYYIGKGKDGRAYNEYHGVGLPTNKSLIVFLETQLTDIGSLALERRLIRMWGRIDIGTGILRNRTDGGEGSAGRIVKQSSKDKQVATRRANGNYIVTQEVRDKISASLDGYGKGIQKTVEHKTNIGLAKSGDKNPMYGKEPWNKGLKKEKPVKIKKKPGAKKGSSNSLKGRVSHLLGSVKEINTCPHCNKEGGKGAMQRWHFENCKLRIA